LCIFCAGRYAYSLIDTGGRTSSTSAGRLALPRRQETELVTCVILLAMALMMRNKVIIAREPLAFEKTRIFSIFRDFIALSRH